MPVNVNYRYVDHELAYLLDNSDAAALVYHDEFADTVASARRRAHASARRSRATRCATTATGQLAPGARHYDDVVARVRRDGASGCPRTRPAATT